MNDKHDDTHWGVYLFKHGAIFQVAPEVANLGNWQLLGIALKEKEKHNQNTGDLKDLKNRSKHHTHKRKPKNISSNQHAVIIFSGGCGF